MFSMAPVVVQSTETSHVLGGEGARQLERHACFIAAEILAYAEILMIYLDLYPNLDTFWRVLFLESAPCHRQNFALDRLRYALAWIRAWHHSANILLYVAGLQVERQNALFSYFEAVLEAEVRVAKSEGKYSEGVSDLPATSITMQVLPTSPCLTCNTRGLCSSVAA